MRENFRELSGESQRIRGVGATPPRKTLDERMRGGVTAEGGLGLRTEQSAFYSFSIITNDLPTER